MATYHPKWDIGPVLAAARSWLTRCWLADGAVLSDDVVWTVTNLDELKRLFVDNPDEGERNFYEKLEDQLRPGSEAASQLMAEALWVLALFPSKTGASTKRESVLRVLAWKRPGWKPDAAALSDAVLRGIGSAGTAYNTQRWRELNWLILASRAFKELSAAQREALLRDPWAFAAWTTRVPEKGRRQFPHMLRYFAFPHEFERIASVDDKRAILAAFGKGTAAALKKQDDVALDRALLELRGEQEKVLGTDACDFYNEPLRSKWKKEPPIGPPDPPATVRTWVIAPGHDAEHWDEWREQGVITVGYGGVGDLSKYASKEAIEKVLAEGRDGDSRPTNHALACWQFAHEMQVGDVVYVKQGRQRILGRGVITGPYVFRDVTGAPPHVRSARWELSGDWVVPDDELFALKTLTDLTPYREFTARLGEVVGGSEDDRVAEPTDLPPPPPSPDAEAYPLDALSRDTGYDIATLSGWLNRLRRKRQIVLQGPPGTGKTFIAERLARHVIGATPGFTRTVQFHPAYAYEDFVQGIRPSLQRGQLGFDLVAGHFVTFCEDAQKRGPETPCVLVIDEINRAKLSQVFGELMYLLEYRDSEVLLAGGRRFGVPANVLIIATMNTADRSIALVDHALRRRFSFITVRPAYDVLQGHLEREGVRAKGIVEALQRVNREIDDANYELGISFFMQPRAVLERDLREIWSGEIEPYLEEFFFDKPEEKMLPLRWPAIRKEYLDDWPE